MKNGRKKELNAMLYMVISDIGYAESSIKNKAPRWGAKEKIPIIPGKGRR